MAARCLFASFRDVGYGSANSTDDTARLVYLLRSRPCTYISPEMCRFRKFRSALGPRLRRTKDRTSSATGRQAVAAVSYGWPRMCCVDFRVHCFTAGTRIAVSRTHASSKAADTARLILLNKLWVKHLRLRVISRNTGLAGCQSILRSITFTHPPYPYPNPTITLTLT